MKSTTCLRTASSAVSVAAPRTAASAHAASRPRNCASERMVAIASFKALVCSAGAPSAAGAVAPDAAAAGLLAGSGIGVVPPSCTGVAAPRCVAGAIAAICPAYRMYVPAEAARAPPGATYASTGNLLSSMRAMIKRIDSDRPPGVSMRNTIATAPSADARVTASSKYSAAAGPMGPTSATWATMGAVPAAARGATSAVPTNGSSASAINPVAHRQRFIVLSECRHPPVTVARTMLRAGNAPASACHWRG